MPRQRTATCPCGLGPPYDECCGRWHRTGRDASTAERLMRSRYSAFVVRDAPYLLRTWHPSTRPRRLELDDVPAFTRLDVLETTGGGLFDTEGTVHFRAHYTDTGGRPAVLDENSAFVREEGRWYYLAPISGS